MAPNESHNKVLKKQFVSLPLQFRLGWVSGAFGFIFRYFTIVWISQIVFKCDPVNMSLDRKMSRMLYVVGVPIVLTFGLVNCHFTNISRNFRDMHTDPFARALQRTPKFLSFTTLDEDIKVDLEFLVPFVKIPVKRSMDATGNAMQSLVNLNTASLLITGVVVAAGAAVGALFTTFNKPSVSNGFQKKSRVDDVSDHQHPFKFVYRNAKGEKVVTPFGEFMDSLENTFRESDIDITSCVQKSLCSYIRQSSENVKRGHGSSTNKIIDGLTSSSWLLSFIEGTAIREAIDAGGSGKHCTQKYYHCKWSESQIMELLFKYISFY